MRMIEGNRFLIIREDGSVSDGTPQRISAKITIKDDELAEPQLVMRKFEEAAKEMARKKLKLLLQRVKEAADEVGNVVARGSEGFTADTLLQLLDKLLVDFTPDGQPIFPSIVGSDSNKEELQAALRTLQTESAYADKLRRLISVKREEWRARESDRRLVD